MHSDSPLWNPDAPVPPPGEHELPYEDDVPMETNEHRVQMVLLIQSLKLALADRDDFFVGGNMFIYFSETQIKNNSFRGPDVFVVLGTSPRSRLSWVAWGEGGKLPDVVIELLSNRTRHLDRGEKMQIYSKVWRTPEYFLYDPLSHELEGYRLNSSTLEYEPIAPTADGALQCSVLGFGLGVREGVVERFPFRWLRWLDAKGAVLPSPEELAAATRERAEAEHARAEAEHERAEAALRRVKELEAQLRKPGGG